MRKQEWIDAKVAAGADRVMAEQAARMLERDGKFAETVEDPALAAFDAPTPPPEPKPDRTSAQRAALDFASDDPGGFTAEVERLKNAREKELARDQPEMPEAERRDEVEEEAASFRQFPGDRAGAMADLANEKPIGRLLFGYPTRLDKPETRDEKRRQTAREFAAGADKQPGVVDVALAPYESMLNTVGLDTSADSMGEVFDRTPWKRIIEGGDESVAATDAEAQGIGKQFSDPERSALPAWRRAAGLAVSPVAAPVETALRFFGGDEFDFAEVPSAQDAAEVAERWGTDRDVQQLASIEGMANAATRAAINTPFAEVGIDAGQALGTMDSATAQMLRDRFRESRALPAFDAVADLDDDAAVLEASGELRPVDLPQILDAKVPPIAQVRRALEADPSLRGAPGMGTLARYLDEGRSDEHLTAALQQVPLATLRRVTPDVGPSVAEIRAAADFRRKAREATGGEAGEAAERLMASAMLTKEGDRYVPSTVANMMRLAGAAEEMVVEADVGLPSAPLAAALATALGAPEETVAMLAKARIPTKAGLDTMLATGAYDGLLARWGLGPYQPRYSPDEKIPYFARVLTNITLSEEQGAGYQDIARRAGVGVGSEADQWLGALDIGVDTLVPFEEMIGGPIFGIGRAAIRGTRAAKLAPAAARLRAAFAGVAPSTSLALEAADIAKVRRGTDAYQDFARQLDADVAAGKISEEQATQRKSYAVTSPDVADYVRQDAEIAARGETNFGEAVPRPMTDAVTAVSQSIGLAARDAVRRGEDPSRVLPGPVRSQIADVLRGAGADPDGVVAAVKEWSEKARPMYLDAVGDMLRQGGTPEQVALRSHPEYRRVRSEVVEFARSGNLTPEQVDAQMALLEVAAHVDAGLNFGTPEGFFGRLNYRSGGDAGGGALFAGGRDRASVPTRRWSDWFEGESARREALAEWEAQLLELTENPRELDPKWRADVADLREHIALNREAAPEPPKYGRVPHEGWSSVYDGDSLYTVRDARGRVVGHTDEVTSHEAAIRLVAEELFEEHGPRGMVREVGPDPDFARIDAATAEQKSAAKAFAGRLGAEIHEADEIARAHQNPLLHVEDLPYGDGYSRVVGVFDTKTDAWVGRPPPAWSEGVTISRVDELPDSAVEVLHSADAGTIHGSIQGFTRQRELAPTYYSALRRAVDNLKGEKFGADQLRAALRNTPGVKADEIEWAGLERFLEGKKSVPKGDVLAWLDENGVRVEERVLGGSTNTAPYPGVKTSRQGDVTTVATDDPAWFGAHKVKKIDHEDGAFIYEGDEYDSLDDAVAAARADLEGEWGAPAPRDETQYGAYTLPGGGNYREVLFKMPGDAGYQAPHFGPDGENLLAHARVNDRVGPNGEKILFVEEVQSDWHQAGREKGYRGAAPPPIVISAIEPREMSFRVTFSDGSTTEVGRGIVGRDAGEAEVRRYLTRFLEDKNRIVAASDQSVPNAPFAKTWPDLVMKRLLRMAAEGDYDGIAWTPGIVQVKRYEDATRAAVDEIRYERPKRMGEAAERRFHDAVDAHQAADDEVGRLLDEGASEREVDAAIDVRDAAEAAVEAARSDVHAAEVSARSYRGGESDVEVIGLKNGRETYRDTLPPENLPDVLGKEIARKITESPDASGSLTGPDLTVGGEGMKGFYDRMLPNIVQGLAKKHGGKVGQTVIGDTPTPYLPLTPQLRDAVLFEGQPLFMRDRTGSIEPQNAPDLTNATDYLIRLYKTGDMQTLLHEHGHLLRFVFGNDWMDGLMRHFDNDGARLTVKGEEQAAEALRWYLRTRMAPNGRLRAKLDDVAVMMQNAWLRLRREPDLVPPELAAQWDDTLRPDQPVRAAAVSVVEAQLRDAFPQVDVAPTPVEQISDDAVRKAGQRREAQRVGTATDTVRQALNLRNSQTTANALDLYTNAVAYVAAEQFRKGWGLDDGVRLTTRTIVPAARAKQVGGTVRARIRLALGIDPATLKVNDAGELVLNNAQRAGYDALVQEAADSPMGMRLPREVIDGTAPPTPENYNAVVEVLLDHHAGPGARRSRAAEDVPQTVGYATVRALRDSPLNPLPMNKLREWFVVPEIAEGYIDPGVREVLESTSRALGEVHRWVYGAAQKAKAGDVAGALQGVRAQLVPPVQPPAVGDLSRLRSFLTDPAGAMPDDVFAAVPDIQTAFGAGVTKLSDNEAASLTALRQLDANGFDPTDLAQAALYADAVERVTDGLNRRWALVQDDAQKILLAAAGSNDATIIKMLTAEQLAGAYGAFYSGDWERLFAFTANLGHDTGMADYRPSRFRPGLAVLEMLARLRGNEVMREMAEGLMQVGVTGTSDALTAARPLGDAPAGGRSAFLDRVQHYVEAETDWKATVVNNPDPDGIRVGPPVPEGGEDLEAYTQAHRLLAQWGFKYGKGNEWVRRTLPSGEELLLPKMVSDEIDAALDRVAKVGTAYGQAPAASARGAALSGEDIDLPIGVAPKSTSGQVLTEAVATALRKLVGVIPYTLSLTKIGITTGIGLANPAYYVGNVFGGMLQMYAAMGAKATGRALLSEPRMTTALVARMFGEGKFRPSAKPIVAADGRIYTVDALERLAQREGLSGSFVAVETARGLARDIKRLNPKFWRKMMNVPGDWQRMLTETAQASDNFYRVSAFVDALKQGQSPASAAELARKVGFDYSALTDFEKRYMRNTVMFYSFMRRNMDLFYDTLLTNPSRVLGQLRMLRGANEHFLGEEGEIVTPSYLEGRLILAARSAAYQGNIGHNKESVITVAPPLGVVDAINLHADVLDVLTDAARLREGGPDAGLDLLGRLTPQLQIPIVLYMDKDPFTKRAVSSPARVPANLVEWDRMATGGVVVDNFLGVQRADASDSSYEEAAGQDEWKAHNARAWWIYTHALQFPGAGRSLDTLAAMDRANLGIVEAAIGAARAVNPAGVKQPGSGDTMEPRAGLTEAEELGGLFAFKPVKIDTREVAEDRLYSNRRRDLEKRTKEAEMGEPR